MNMEEEMMSPTTRLAQQDVMSPLEDLELDGMDVGMMSEDETLKTTTPGMRKIFQFSFMSHLLLIHWIYESKFPFISSHQWKLLAVLLTNLVKNMT